MVRICLVGEGAIADIHAQCVSKFNDAKLSGLVCANREDGLVFAKKWRIPFVTSSLDEALARNDVDAAIIASPSALHAAQAGQAIRAGKHVLVEIPIGLNIAECRELSALASEAQAVVMACHTRRFSPAHGYLRAKMNSGELQLQHLVAETFFFRRKNLNMLGQMRTWVDNLLWHHACHSIDLFIWLTGDAAPQPIAQSGPVHPELGIAMDMTIGLRAANGALLSLSLSFNNQGPFGGFYRYICDNGTFHVFRDELRTHERALVPLTGSAFNDQDRGFIDAIQGKTLPTPTIADCLPAMSVIDRIERQLATREIGNTA